MITQNTAWDRDEFDVAIGITTPLQWKERLWVDFLAFESDALTLAEHFENWNRQRSLRIPDTITADHFCLLVAALRGLVDCPDYRGISTHEMREAQRVLEHVFPSF